MITTAPTTALQPSLEIRPSRLLSWGAIFGGCFAALSIHILLTMLGLGLGVRLVSPATNDNPASDFTVAAGLVWTISALVSLFVGGWIAGRSVDVGERRTGGLHGFVVWSLSTVVVFTFLSSGASLALGTAARAIGKGIAGTAQVVGAAAPKAADAAQSSGIADVGQDMVRDMVGELRFPGQQGDLPVAAKREIGVALARFAANPTDDRRNALMTAMTNAGAPRDFAESAVRRWEDSINRLKAQARELQAEAEQKAREVADKAAKGISQGAIWTFVAFLLGAVAAGVGGRIGARSAIEAPAREAAADLGVSIPKREDVART